MDYCKETSIIKNDKYVMGVCQGNGITKQWDWPFPFTIWKSIIN